MRTRRDHARFLNLIEVSAFLHQFQRERKDEAVLAAVEDYAVAYELSREVLSDTLSDVKKPLSIPVFRAHDGRICRANGPYP